MTMYWGLLADQKAEDQRKLSAREARDVLMILKAKNFILGDSPEDKALKARVDVLLKAL